MDLPISSRIILRNDTRQNWTAKNPTLERGEAGFESNTGRLKIGDGISRWKDLNYVGMSESSIVDTPLPGIQIKIVSKQQKRSLIFTNESNPIENIDIYFRPKCTSVELMTMLKSTKIHVGLIRRNARSRRMINRLDSDGFRVSLNRRGYHVIGTTFCKFLKNERYPYKTHFILNNPQNKIYWTPEFNLPPIEITTLIESSTYKGEWIKLPYSLESILRRYIFIETSHSINNPKEVTVLPISYLATGYNEKAYVKIAGSKTKMGIHKERVDKRQYSMSMPLGLCFCTQPNMGESFQYWAMGEPVFFTGRIMALKNENQIKYLASIHS